MKRNPESKGAGKEIRHGMHGRHRDDETGEHKGHAHAGSSDGSAAKNGRGSCH